MKSVCEQSSQQQNNQNQINSIYFMYDNLIEISSNLKEFIDRNIELHKSNIDQLQKNVFWILLITCIVFIITSILSIPLIKQINKYQEIIYFTFSRTTLEETEKEIAKLELFNKNLINQDNSWMEYNFCSDFILDKTTQEFNSKESSTAHSISNVLRQKKLKKDNNSNQQQNINSKMNDSKLSIFKYFIQLTFFGFTFVCFFTASIIFFYRQHSYLKQQLDVFNTTMKARLSFQSILTTSEIAFRKDMILSVDQNFPFDKNEQSVNIFQKDIEILSSYTTYMSNAIQDTSIFDNQSINYLQSLFNQSLCDKFQNEEVCQSTNNSTTKENVINGFFSVISSYLNYFQQFNQLLQSGLSQGQITKLSWEYSSQDQYKYLIAYGFQLPAETFGLIQNQLYSLIRDLIKLIQQFYTFYMIIGEIILIFIWIIFSFYFKQKIKLDVKSTQFALTCLPFQKAQEDTTIHLLRSILKY